MTHHSAPRPSEITAATSASRSLQGHQVPSAEKDGGLPNVIVVFTDGGARLETGTGAWAYVAVNESGRWREESGNAKGTTNNRMELTAVVNALRDLPPVATLVICSDSCWVVKGATLWRSSWEARGWRNSQNRVTAHKDLWLELDALVRNRDVRFLSVPAHRGLAPNERADALASSRLVEINDSEDRITRKPDIEDRIPGLE